MILRLANAEDKKKIKEIYNEAFPAVEKKPFFQFRRKHVKLYALIDDEVCVGLFIAVEHKDMVFIDYFAIDKNCRGKGYGSTALTLLKNKYEGKRIFLEIEDTMECLKEHKELREKRKQFYMTNGFLRSHLRVNAFTQDFEIMYYSSDISFDEYTQTFKNGYGSIVSYMMHPKKL